MPLQNLMHDKRIVRGSTFGAKTRQMVRQSRPVDVVVSGGSRSLLVQTAMRNTNAVPVRSGRSTSSGTSSATSTKFFKTATRALAQQELAVEERPITPPAVEGRVHAEIQTDNYLEDLRKKDNKVVQETQTGATCCLHFGAPHLLSCVAAAAQTLRWTGRPLLNSTRPSSASTCTHETCIANKVVKPGCAG